MKSILFIYLQQKTFLSIFRPAERALQAYHYFRSNLKPDTPMKQRRQETSLYQLEESGIIEIKRKYS